MSKKDKKPFSKLGEILKGSSHSEWCYVDTENMFTYNGQQMRIDEDVEEYKVFNKSYENEDYTNEATMEHILVVVYPMVGLEGFSEIKFYNQKYEPVTQIEGFETAEGGEGIGLGKANT